ncbi:MAG: hypothetical protein REI78_09775 [Pedobacter sp.]|nr:hypothetical protein [Pedobacter sp.]MDQ8053304.1 hypothetical protein [Pedobacter sp.]
MNELFVPAQVKGKQFDVAAERGFEQAEESTTFYQHAKERLLDVNNWDKTCGLPSTTFKLINAKNQEIIGPAKVHDFIRINIPGPGSMQGEGYDWVTIVSIDEQTKAEEQILSMTVRPAPHPQKPFGPVAHFFSNRSSSTFQVIKRGHQVLAEIHGRNELANPEGHLFDRLRNKLIAFGAKIGFSYPQWKLLAEGLVR